MTYLRPSFLLSGPHPTPKGSAGSRRRRSGVAAIILVVSMAALLASGALIVDIGYANLVGAQLQNGLDAAAMAGASRLAEGPEAVRAAAIRVASLNRAGGNSIPILDTDVKIGTWSDGAFTTLSGADEEDGNAVLIERSDAGVPAFLAHSMGISTLTVVRSSIAGVAGLDSVVCGVLVDTFADLRGNMTIDSYNSTLGAYGSTNQASNGGVCSNDSLSATGSVVVEGGLRYGPDASDWGTVSGAAHISGDCDAMEDEIVLPTVDSTWYRTHNDNSQIGRTSRNRNPMSGTAFSMNSTDRLTLAAGTYYFSSFSLNGQAQLTTSGPVTIYVDGNFTANGGGIVNSSANPANLTIMLNGSTGDLRINGSADFYGSIIAPQRTGTLNGNADFYGMIVANRMDMLGNGDFHADEAMVSQHVGETPSNRRTVIYQ